ncbi:chemotaxis protein CheW [Acetivibrio saccincola]|uniref:Chemotaxis protein CheW n=1 Tax=Acetivibrio saccincola TaxID=1677857 RepID=A0A2K9EMW7_9FIRM|nr:chemotaxis protein CheW [Acetivibrio saccincola]AUG57951.1 Chemotaxis protein CheW [Acetivibrio saccincola]NLW27413.1 chemotaxis protein CheW [Acetivibrio saccincola]PQQ67844.1 chemotaxis protein CheW [Acetivibrio saccincola]HOA97546.1 chemotaxis protein CheW [Acetivibrio saccincola]HQD28510.1 chemotaxis protein CheW [Acetivibrio saccincola]
MSEGFYIQNRQFVVFKLGTEEYGVDIQNVTTIEKMLPITRVPKAPHYIKGVINLRGDIIPVIDIKEKLGLGTFEETDETRIIILQLKDIPFGVIVDEVDEVLQLREETIENVSNFTNDLSLDYISGVGKVDDRIVSLLNFKKLIDIDETGSEKDEN